VDVPSLFKILKKELTMKIAVTSASGQLGKTIVNCLAENIGEKNVIAIARTPENASFPDYPGVEIRKGDYNSKSEFLRAFEGVNAVLLVSGNDAPEKRIQQHAGVIEAAKEAGVKKLVYTSILGPKESTGFSAIVNSNRITEEHLRNSGLQWSIGRNGVYIEPDIEYIENYKKEGKISNCAGEGKCAYTTRDELAFAYYKMLTENEHNSKTYNLTGGAITQNELADYINIAFGTELVFEPVSVEAYRKERQEELGERYFDVRSDYREAAGRDHIKWSKYFAELRG
jgi:NAD(P)H dehydrogenase (quinone)